MYTSYIAGGPFDVVQDLCAFVIINKNMTNKRILLLGSICFLAANLVHDSCAQGKLASVLLNLIFMIIVPVQLDRSAHEGAYCIACSKVSLYNVT